MKRNFYLSCALLGALSMLAHNGQAQTIDIGPNQYAFRLTSNPNFGLFFNGTNQRYEFMNGTGTPILGFNANTGDFSTNLRFASGSDYLVANNSYAFRSSSNPNYGLFFNSNNLQYEFRNASATSILSVDATNGHFRNDLQFSSGNSLRVAAGNWAIRSASAPAAGIFFGVTDFEVRSINGTPILTLNASSGATTFSNTVSAPGGNSTLWNQAHGWGNHASQGYINAETDPKIGAITSNRLPVWNGSQLVTSPVETGSDFAQILGSNASLRINSNGFLGGNAKIQFTNGAMQSGEIYSALGVMIYNNNATIPVHNFQTNGVNRLTITEDGKVAINSSGDANSELKIGRTSAGGRGLDVSVTYVGNSDVRGVYARSVTNDGYGVGGEFSGGFKGVIARGEGGSYTGTTRAVEAITSGSGVGTKVAVYGSALGGANNWAGWFQNGNVYVANELRIGNTEGATGYKLAVNGRTMATEMRVQALSNWPDYVYEENYERLTIDELETYVKTHKHLPGVPSADDVEAEGGFDLGHMQKIALEKIEEMSLYIIEQNKMIKELRNEVDLLKQKRH